jgi:fatty acid amide hydrolase
VGQALFSYEADNPLFGRSSNPWSLDRSPGGSSGGEAAIVAAGGSALGFGADLGGSVRVPAHFCGIHSLKPTAMRLTNLDTPDGIFCDQETVPPQPGPMARHVRDLQLAMSVLAAPGMDRLDPSVPAVPWTESHGVEGLRVGWYEDDGAFRPSPGLRRAVREAVAALAARGATIEQWAPPDVTEAQRLFMVLAVPDRFASIRRALRGNPVDRRLAALLRSTSFPSAGAPLVAALMARGGQARMAWMVGKVGAARTTAAAYAAAVGERARYRQRFLAAMDERNLDILICPPYGLPALRHGADEALSTFVGASYSQLYNVLGMPAGVVSLTRVLPEEETDRPQSRDRTEQVAGAVERGSAGLPVGVQVVGRHWREDLVLAAMEVLEDEFRRRVDYPMVVPL